MHDLNQIAAINQRAVRDSIPAIQQRNLYAVAQYDGLRLVRVSEHNNEIEADQAVERYSRDIGTRCEVFRPLAATPDVREREDNAAQAAIHHAAPLAA